MNIQEQEKTIFLNDTRKLSQKELILTIKELITEEFQKYLNIAGLDYITEFYSIDRKQEILNNIQEQLRENNPKEIEEYFNNFYYKILKEQEKIYKLNDIYLYNKQMKEAEKITRNKNNNQKIFEIAKKTLYIITAIVFAPIIFILFGTAGAAMANNTNRTNKRR